MLGGELRRGRGTRVAASIPGVGWCSRAIRSPSTGVGPARGGQVAQGGGQPEAFLLGQGGGPGQGQQPGDHRDPPGVRLLAHLRGQPGRQPVGDLRHAPGVQDVEDPGTAAQADHLTAECADQGGVVGFEVARGSAGSPRRRPGRAPSGAPRWTCPARGARGRTRSGCRSASRVRTRRSGPRTRSGRPRRASRPGWGRGAPPGSGVPGEVGNGRSPARAVVDPRHCGGTSTTAAYPPSGHFQPRSPAAASRGCRGRLIARPAGCRGCGSRRWAARRSPGPR